MLKYIFLIILVVTIFSLFSLFEEPATNHLSQKPNREVAIEEVEVLKDVSETSEMNYNQDAMDFLMNAYGVGNS